MVQQHTLYRFTLVLSGISEPDEWFENALFEAGCDDALLSFRNRIGYLDFDRSADDFEKSILSAIHDVESIHSSIMVVAAEPSDRVTSAEIARRSGRSRESIRQLINGYRGTQDFPVPMAGIISKTLLWSWAKVAKWMFDHGKIEDYALVEQARIIKQINLALEIRNDSTSTDAVKSYLSELSNYSLA